jgi:multicomponent Na+:H+ antiporter subunit G
VSEVRTALVLACTAIGCGFILLAAVGVVRMPDLYSRMQASGKGATVGAIVTVIGAAIHFGAGPIIIRGGVIAGFLFVTVPIAVHLIARAGFVTGAELEPGAVIDETRTGDRGPGTGRAPDA